MLETRIAIYESLICFPFSESACIALDELDEIDAR